MVKTVEFEIDWLGETNARYISPQFEADVVAIGERGADYFEAALIWGWPFGDFAP